ncbi:MAG TPA: glycoside hydrolase family 88 protein [Bacteroidota bacterium]
MLEPERVACLFAIMAVFMIIVCSVPLEAQTGHEDYFKSWPAGSSPDEIGKRVAQRFIDVPQHQNFGRTGRPDRITYPEVCTWFGALMFAEASKDETLRSALVKRFEPLLGPVEWPDHPAADARGRVDERDIVPAPDHVDHTVFASVPLELFMQTKDQRYRDLGVMMADWQWVPDPIYKFPFDHPALRKYFPNRVNAQSLEYAKRGLTWQTRMWIDDMFMITAAQAQAHRATGDRKYIDRAAKEMVVYLDSLQQSNGLFYHAPDVPFFWGRGNGWMAAGMSLLLRSLPSDNPDRTRILNGYRTMMTSLLKHQGEDGMWRQLIDRPESWQETSCTGMFTFAFIMGVKHGWLDAETYGPAARKGWLGLIKYIDENADIREVCEGTNKRNDYQYYIDRKRNVGDMHGQAPVLWCASALLR